MNIKVQCEVVTNAAIIKSGLPTDGQLLTFHAFSEKMKARVLERLAQGENFTISVTDEQPQTGEWFENPGH